MSVFDDIAHYTGVSVYCFGCEWAGEVEKDHCNLCCTVVSASGVPVSRPTCYMPRFLLSLAEELTREERK